MLNRLTREAIALIIAWKVWNNQIYKTVVWYNKITKMITKLS